MNSIYAITTHHERPSDAAEAWKENNVCAIGWSHFGALNEKDPKNYKIDIQDFLKIKKGDLILAYSKNNIISYIGEVETGEYLYTRKNIVGWSEKEGGFDYANQYVINWFKTPQHFTRKVLPSWLSEQLGKMRKTVIPIDLQGRSFGDVKQIILDCARSESHF